MTVGTYVDIVYQSMDVKKVPLKKVVFIFLVVQKGIITNYRTDAPFFAHLMAELLAHQIKDRNYRTRR